MLFVYDAVAVRTYRYKIGESLCNGLFNAVVIIAAYRLLMVYFYAAVSIIRSVKRLKLEATAVAFDGAVFRKMLNGSISELP